MIEIHLEKEIGWLDLFQPNGALYDFGTTGVTTAEQMLKAISMGEDFTDCFSGKEKTPQKQLCIQERRFKEFCGWKR